ncbi:MAG: ribonuclease, partial [Firmicutes bacterium]|nr:ribonuclease [Bacillota bacterium]
MGSGESSSPGEATRTEQAQGPSGGSQQGSSGGGSSGQAAAPKLDEGGSYTSKEDVALYLWTYGKLPGNFITKSAAQKKGWEGGSLEKYAPGKSIGGDRFGNYEKLLPEGI